VSNVGEPQTPAVRLRELIAHGSEPLLLIGCVDALTARIASEAGFQAVYATGAGIANSQLGVPDIGLLTATEMLTQVERIVSAVDVPVVADIDTGYGNALNAARAMRAFERAGVAGVQIEDQVFPKQCGHFEGTEVILRGEFLAKLAAVLDARRDEDVVVIARTDAIGSLGVDEAIDRGRANAEAGADVVFVEAPPSRAVLERLPREIAAPLLVNVVEGGRTPQLSVAELGALGYRIVLFANTALRLAARAVREGLAELRASGSSAALLDRLLPWDERQRLVGLPEYRALADRYAKVENHSA
jgi:2-methylisocitrate lyase-like PEP mutase family enzyme